jgi:carbon-monoxide dehydrogenase medium subunit
MKPAPFRYYDPATIDEALALLSRCDNARALAGGQSLVPMLNFRFVQPDHLVDLNRIPALDAITIEPRCLVFGAMARQRTIERHAGLAEAAPIIPAALAHVGHRQTRNRGTIGGSLCHLDPSAELVNLACLHDAKLTVRSARGERTLDFAEFAQGYLTTALEPDELLLAIELERWPSSHGWGFEELARRQGDFAIAAASALIDLDAAGKVFRAALCVSGVEPVPVRLATAEAMLTGTDRSQESFRAAAAEVERLEAMDDAYINARYRKHVARVLVTRALDAAMRSAREARARHA